MATTWADALIPNIEQVLSQLATVVRDCTDELWESPMWEVPTPADDQPFLDADWQPVTDPEKRRALAEQWVRRWSTPWSVAWHALECLDYDLSGDLVPWLPPPPFMGHPHFRDLPSLPTAWSRDEIVAYIDYCGQRVRDTLTGMPDEKAATPLPSSHRWSPQTYAWLITGFVGHTAEHASQIRQFITTAGIAPQGG